MSKLDDILIQQFEAPYIVTMQGIRRVDTRSVTGEDGKQELKELIRDLVDETFPADDANAYEFWQKVEAL